MELLILFNLDLESLVNCFPEKPDEFEQEVTVSRIYIYHRDLDKYDVVMSRLELIHLGIDVMELKYVAITEAYQDMGYGRKLLSELFMQCMDRRLLLVVDDAYYPTTHILEGFVEDCEFDVLFSKEACERNEAWDLTIDSRSDGKKPSARVKDMNIFGSEKDICVK